VPDLATLRLTREPRMLSILRMMVGLLYMEHGLAKVLGFPLQPNHAPYALFNLNPGLQGLLELVGGLLLALGLFTRTVAFILAGDMAVAYFIAHAPRGFSTAGSWQSSIASSSSISGSPVVANGASIAYARPHPRPPCRRAGPNHRWQPSLARPSDVLGMASDLAAFNLPARVEQLFGVSL
jgi:putative oxidoreductase